MLFSCQVISDSLLPHGLQHARPTCLSPSLSLPKFTSTESVTPSSHLILHHPLFLPSVFSSIRAFFNESTLCIRWPKYWSSSFSISSSSDYSGLISFRIDSFELLTIQRTLKSLLQHHSAKASLEIQNEGISRVTLALKPVGKNLSLLLSNFWDPWPSLVFLDFLLYHCKLGLDGHMIFSSCVWSSNGSLLFYMNTSHVEVGPKDLTLN